MKSIPLWLALALLHGGCRPPEEPGQVFGSADSLRASVLTQHNDNLRSGANLLERDLTPELVRSHFGFLFSLPVDGYVYAQPLYVADLDLGAPGVHDVLYVATEHDSVYAFDANQPGPPLWQKSFGPASNLRCFPQPLLTPEIGITGTPVVDRAAGLLYLVAFTQDDPASCDGASFHHLLYALDLATGESKVPPVEIAATAPLAFATRDHLQRAALLLSNGVLYIAFASHADRPPYHGWLFAHDARSLAELAAFVATPSGDEGGIWMSGQGPAADENGKVYLSTGNGTFDADQGGPNVGDSILRLSLDGGGNLTVGDSFTPYNQADLQARDLDLGSMGPLLLPGVHSLGGSDHRLVIAGGKEGKLYLLDRDHLGGFNAGGDQVLQTVSVTNANIHGGPVWLDDGAHQRLYVWAEEDDLKAFELADSTSGAYLSQVGASTVPRTTGMPGGFLAVSAAGTGQGIVWANHPWSPEPGGSANAIGRLVPGVLRAFDAADLSVELWNNRADANAPPEAAGDFAKFCAPTIANGKVYLAAWSKGATAPGKVIVYGKLAQ